MADDLAASQITAIRTLLTSLGAVLSHATEHDEEIVRSVASFGQMICAAGSTDICEILFRAGLKAYQEAGAASDQEVADLLRSFGAVWLRAGELNTAEMAYRIAFALADAAVGPTHSSSIAAVYQHAVVLEHLGHEEQALASFRDALDRAETRDPSGSPETIEIRSGLAKTQIRLGHLDDALDTVDRAVEICEVQFGKRHPEYAALLDITALALKQRHRIERAEILQRRAVKILFESVEPFQDRGQIIGNLAGTLIQAGQRAEAQPLLERALSEKRRACGADHPTVAHTLNTLAILAAQDGDFVTARAHAAEALRIRRARLGDSHPETEQSRRLHAQILEDRRNE
jgi:tetratricopeptide (TPR) repeat protein